MKECLFFLSYARDDRKNDQDNRIERFYNDLEEYVRRRYGGPVDNKIGFFDSRSTTTGDLWTPSADRALQTCKVFVTIYSPTYFTREYCGQEWEIFQTRLKDYQDSKEGKNSPSLIMPVLFVGKPHLEETLKTMKVSDIVYLHKDDPLQYVEGGLEGFMLDKFKDEYTLFVGRFADRIIELIKTHPLPQRLDLPSVATVTSAFHKPKPKETGRRSTEQDKNPDYVEFLFLVGSRAEMRAVRHYVESYGKSGADWKAYEPLLDQKIGIMAQTIAGQESFLSTIVQPGRNLTDWLKDTRKNNHIAVIVVDSWTLRSETYANLARDYDTYDSLHSLMLVCLNSDDAETKKKQAELKRSVQAIFQTKIKRGPNSNFLYPLSTSEEFESNLVASLGKIKMELLNFDLDKLRLKKIQAASRGNGEAEQVESQPTHVMPSIPGPGGQ